MEKDPQGLDQELPPIPDYPDAPLPAWKHYGITSYADRKILEELTRVEYPGYMIGMEMAYTVESEEVYCMQFGDTAITEAMLQKSQSQEPDPKLEQEASQDLDEELPLSDDFLSDLYDDVRELIKTNTPDYSGEVTPELTIAITGSKKVIKFKCRVPEVCKNHHTDKRKCKSINGGPWKCTHKKRC